MSIHFRTKRFRGVFRDSIRPGTPLPERCQCTVLVIIRGDQSLVIPREDDAIR